MSELGFSCRSELAEDADALWSEATLGDVNRELAPWVRMTAPRRWRQRPIAQWPQRKPLFYSRILLLGLFPVDHHRFYFEQIDANGFVERSRSWGNVYWQHERRLQSTSAGCVLTDTVRYRSRMPLLGRLLLPLYRALFRHRHARLRRRYGVPA